MLNISFHFLSIFILLTYTKASETLYIGQAITPTCFPRCQDSAAGCQQVFKASQKWKYITSPNYPGKFAKQTQCNWIIRAPRRYRVELTFENFYLLGGMDKKKSCFTQYLIVRDVFSGIADGRYCGNTLPPDLVSTGDTVRVSLESNVVRPQSLFYQGFRAKYRASRLASSIRLRDSRGRWKQYAVIGGDIIVTTTTTTTTLSTRDPNEVDENNNAEIDAANNQINRKIINNNEIINKRNNHLNLAPVLPKNTVTTTKLPSKFRLPSRRRTSSPPLTPQNTKLNKAPNSNQHQPGLAVIIHDNDDASEASVDLAVIIGGVVGGIVIFLLLLIFVVRHFRKKKSATKTSHVITTAPANSIKKRIKKSNHSEEPKSLRLPNNPEETSVYQHSRTHIINRSQLPGYSARPNSRSYTHYGNGQFESRDSSTTRRYYSNRPKRQ